MAGKHGMRISQQMSPMTPGMARLPMQPESFHRELNCLSCHGTHQFDTRYAATDSCLNCHQDSHSLAFKSTPHFRLWQQEIAGEIPEGSGVSCATCHLPRMQSKARGKTVVHIDHNQNNNLRPREKMIRSVCLHCHGLEYSIDALSDPSLIENNFNTNPGVHIESMDWIRQLLENKTNKEGANEN